jgi:hypothetical protein
MGSTVNFAWQQFSGPNVRFGSKADIRVRPRHVRFTPKSGHWLSALDVRFVPKADMVRCGERHRHSITSSALASNDGECLRGLEIDDQFKIWSALAPADRQPICDRHGQPARR